MKKAAGLFAIFMMLTLLVGCGIGSSSVSGEKGLDDGKEVLRVGMECAYAPFNWTQTSQELSNGDNSFPISGTNDFAYGYDVMLAQKLADELGKELEIHKVEWSSIVLGLNIGDYDAIIAGMGYTRERANAVDFTAPYYLRDNVIIVRKDSPYAKATRLSEFDGASATTQIGTIWEQYVPQIPNVNQRTYYESTSEVIMNITTGTVDCAVLDEPTAKSAILSNSDLMYVKLDELDGFAIPEGQSLDVCIAVKKGNSELKEKLDFALKSIEWDEEKMLEFMDLSVRLQPLNN